MPSWFAETTPAGYVSARRSISRYQTLSAGLRDTGHADALWLPWHDYFDIYTLLRLKPGGIDRDSLREAVAATASKRGSLGRMSDYEAVLGEVKEFDMMRDIWFSYVSVSPCAAGLDFKEVVDSAI